MDKNNKVASVDTDDSIEATIEIEPLDPKAYEEQMAALADAENEATPTGVHDQIPAGEMDPTLQPLREKLVSVQSQVALQSETILLLEADLKSSSNLIRHLESELTEKTTTLELQAAELDKRQAQIDHLTERGENLDAAVSGLKTDFAVATETAGHAKARLEQKMATIEELRSKHSAELDRSQTLEQQIAGLEAAQEIQESIVRDLQKELSDRQDEINDIRDELASRNNNLSALEERLTQRQTQITELQAEVSTQTTQMNRCREETLQLTKTIQVLKIDLANRTDAVSELENVVADWGERYSQLEGIIAKRDVRITDMESELSEYHKKIKDRDSEHATISQEKEEMGTEIRVLSDQIKEVESDIAKRDARIVELDSKLKSGTRQIRALESELESKSESLNSRSSAIDAQHQTIKVLDQKNIEFQRQSESMQDTLRTRELRITDLESMLTAKENALKTIQMGILKLSEYGTRPELRRKPKEQPNISVIFHEPPKGAANSDCYLVNLDGEGRTRYPLYKSPMTVGRGRANDIQIRNDYISGYHAEFIQTDDGVTLNDLGSTNATRVNAKRISAHDMKDGDIVAFGELRFEYVDEAHRPKSAKTRVARIK